MSIREILKMMVLSFFMIVTGIVAGIWVIGFFVPGLSYSPVGFGRILLTGLLTACLFIIFYSKTDLTAKKMIRRMAIHSVVLVFTTLSLAFYWGWVSLNTPGMIIAIIAIIIIIYATVAGMFFFRDRRFAEKINEAIKRRRR